MTDWVRVILSRHGQTVTVCGAETEETVRAFLQPVTEKKEQVPDTVTGLGYVDERLWLYLGQKEVQPDDRVAWNGMEFRARSSRPYYIGETLMYWWAALEAAKEAAE